MYLELVTTAVAVQRDLVKSYIASGRTRELGIYVLTLNRVTLAFFEKVEPPEKLIDVHDKFLHWQRLGLVTLGEEIRTGKLIASDTSRSFGEASKRFAESFRAFVETAVAKDG